MNKIKLIILAVAAATLFTGCTSVREAYKASPLTPDGLNYTYATDKNVKPEGHWFGVSWSLK